MYASDADIKRIYNDLAVRELIDLRSTDELRMLPQEVRTEAGLQLRTSWVAVTTARAGAKDAAKLQHAALAFRGHPAADLPPCHAQQQVAAPPAGGHVPPISILDLLNPTSTSMSLTAWGSAAT